MEFVYELETVQRTINRMDEDVMSKCRFLGQTRDNMNIELDSVAEYSVKIHNMLSVLRRHPLIDSDQPTLNSTVNSNNATPPLIPPPRQKLALPQIPLPEFNNLRGESLELFLQNFESILSGYSLSDFERFVYLKKQLGNEARPHYRYRPYPLGIYCSCRLLEWA